MSSLPRATPEEIDWGADAICEAVTGAAPFFIGRNGTIELEALFYWFTHRKSEPRKPYPPRILDTLSKNAGVWPATESAADAWATAYADALGATTGLAAGWYAPYRNTEETLLQIFAPQAFTTPLRSLEPYYVEPGRRWTRHLAGKRVAIVSSFAESIELQVSKGPQRVWARLSEPDTILPPTTSWFPVRTYYSPPIAGSPTASCAWPNDSVSNWRDAVEWTTNRVRATEAQVAIIGCGGLGMIIAKRLKAHGISAFVLGGATQVLFGIKGRRWEDHSVISGFWNNAWIWPKATEIPSGAGAIEGGCYWGPVAASERPPTPYPAERPIQLLRDSPPTPSSTGAESIPGFFLP